MKKLIVMYTVSRTNPKGTWSGTSYSLLQALRNYYDVELVDLKCGFFLRIIDKLKNKICIPTFQMIIGSAYDKLLEIKAAFLLRGKDNIPVLEIANEVNIRPPFYLYQDLSLAVLQEEKSYLLSLGVTGGGLRKEWTEAEISRKAMVQKRIYYNAENCFFMGHWVTQRMKEIYPEIAGKFNYAGGGLNKEFNPPKELSIQDKERIVSFIGIDFDRKAGDIVVKAFLRMIEKYNDKAKLYIVGPNSKNFQDSSSIVFIGKAERKFIGEILKKSTVFCMPSRFEAYGLVFPEAMCYGNLCIGRNKYEMPYFLNSETGTVIDTDDVEVLADRMYALLNDKDKLKKAIDMADSKRKEYSWNAVAGRIDEIIKCYENT